MDRLIAIALQLGLADGFDYPVGPPDAQVDPTAFIDAHRPRVSPRTSR